jgi:hypothetical protein
VTIFDSTPTTPIQQLPRAAADAPIYLVRFVGPFTSDEIARKKKSFEVRKDVVVRFNAFLREHNALPAAVNSDVVDAMPTVGLAAGVQVQLVNDVEQSGMNVQQREALERDQLGLDVDRQHRTVMTNTSAAAGGADAQLQRAINILVRRGTTIAASGLDSMILESTFPELFPFGRGGPSEPRAASVCFERCVAHYLALSSHAFGQHATFVRCERHRRSRRNDVERVVARASRSATGRPGLSSFAQRRRRRIRARTATASSSKQIVTFDH